MHFEGYPSHKEAENPKCGLVESKLDPKVAAAGKV